MKKCSLCKIEKPTRDFHKNRGCRDGYNYRCKLCRVKTRNIAWDNTYKKKNRAKLAKKLRLYKRRNKSKVRFYTAKRRALKKKATPSWTTKEDLLKMESFYLAAVAFEKLAGCKLHVDHIVPLQGKEVCGLHTHWNLQLLTEEENLIKRNLI